MIIKAGNLRHNDKTGRIFIISLLLLVSGNFSASAAETNYNKQSSRPDANSTGKITVLVELDEEPLINSYQGFRSFNKAQSLSTQQKVVVKNRFYQKQQQLTVQQNALLQTFTANRIPFLFKRRLQLVTNTVVLEIDAESFDEIKKLKGVKTVHKQRKYHTHLNNSVPVVRAPETWQLLDANNNSVNGQGIRVAIIDTGIDYMHPDLGGGFGPEFKVVGGWDFANDDDDPMDDINHGTHVAGIVAANGDLKGVAPGASLLAYKVFNRAGDAYDSDILAAIEAAIDPDGDPSTDDGAQVINMSLGGPGGHDSPLSQASNAAMSAGVVVVVSAGNSGDYYSVGDPGAAESVITVAATDNEGALASFSSGGPVLGLNANKPEISAPGVNILSTVLNGSTGQMSGTSMSAPHVAGAAALLRQLRPELSSGQIKDLLVASADSKPGNIYREGVAALDIFAATQKALIISPSLVNFGEAANDVTLWQKSGSFTLQNISTESRSFQLSTEASVLEGVSLNILSATDLTLAAGEIKRIDFRLDVDNDSLSVSPHWPSNFEIKINLSDDGNTWQLPVIFHKSHLLSIDSDSSLDFVLYNSSDGSWARNYPVDNLGSFVPVKPGTYKVFSLFAEDINTQNSSARPLIIRDAIDLASTRESSVYLSPTQTDSLIGLDSFVGANGETVVIQDSNSLGFDVRYQFLDVESDLSFTFDGVKNLVVNHVESAIRLSANGFVALKEDTEVNLMTFNDSWLLEPVNHPIELDLRNMESGEFTLDLANDEVATIGLRGWNNEDLLWPFASYWDNPVNQFETQNVNTINVFGQADLNFEESHFFETGLELSLIKQSDGSHVSTQSFSFTEQGLTKFNLSVSDEETWQTTPLIASREMSLNASGLFWSAFTQVEFIGDQTFLRIVQPRLEGLLAGLLPVAPVQDHWLNSYQQDMPFILECDQVQINDGALADAFDYAANIYLVEASRDCETLRMLVTYNNWLDGIKYESSVETLLNNTRGESALALERVSILSAGNPVTQISDAQGQIVVQLAPSIISSVTDFNLELKVDQGEWVALSTEQDDNRFTATVEMPTKLPQVASIRILVKNNLGNTAINTINSAFIYGTNDPMQLDSDDDNVVDGLDAFPNDPLESIDTDGDGVGNNSDLDDDGDQMPDSFELQFNLDPLDPADAQLDLDNDGMSNLEEYKAGRDPTVAEKSGGGSLGYLLLSLLWLLRRKR